MINKLPFIGWLLSLTANTSLSIPFWFFWTWMGLGRTYFYFIPSTYFHIPFWHCVGLFIILGIFKSMIPTIVSVSQSNTNGKQ